MNDLEKKNSKKIVTFLSLNMSYGQMMNLGCDFFLYTITI